MAERDPFQSSLLAQPASWRVLGAAGASACLWLAVLWAIGAP